MLKTIKLRGADARKYSKPLAQLRLKVFFDYPYLYEGDFAYEEKYLETYFSSPNSFILLVQDGGDVVGATTSIPAVDEEESFRKPFEAGGFDVEKVFYFGESLLLPKYRGRGIGKLFFKEREVFARSLGGMETLAFCAVEREPDHSLRPHNYRTLDSFWNSQGFTRQENLFARYKWKDRDKEKEDEKLMRFWLKQVL